MLRVIGALLVAGGGAMAGFSAISQLNERVRSLSSFLGALDIMESEIRFKLTPVPELMELLARRAGAPASTFFQICRDRLALREEESFALLWAGALETQFQAAPEREVLGELGGVLGRYDVEGQRQTIAYVRRRLETFLCEAEEERRSRGKVYGAVGIAMGLCAAVILL